MALTIDEIYDLFTWDASLSDAEYHARVEAGIAEARKLRNIFPFIQPVVVGKNSKSVWEPCAKVVALKSDEELEDYMYLLLEWLQDITGPGRRSFLTGFLGFLLKKSGIIWSSA